MPEQIKETLDFAKEGNAETLRIMAEHSFNVDKVLELKREHTKTEAYIKALKKALAFKEKEAPANEQSQTAQAELHEAAFEKAHSLLLIKKSNRSTMLKIGVALSALLVFGIVGNYGPHEGVKALLGGVAGLFCFMGIVSSITFFFADISYEKDTEYLVYLNAKDWVKMVEDNNMNIPFPFTKSSYANSLKIIEEFEKKNPDKIVY